MYIQIKDSKLGKWIHDRKNDMGEDMTVKTITKFLDWKTDPSLYWYRIKDESHAWKIEEICRMLYLFKCTYEELFRYKPFKNENKGVYIDNIKYAIEITKLINNKGLERSELLNLLSITRQGFYHFLARRKIRISQINIICDYFGCEFSDIFASLEAPNHKKAVFYRKHLIEIKKR